jgi:hypothetical protein
MGREEPEHVGRARLIVIGRGVGHPALPGRVVQI